MIVDTSAIVAILTDEPERDAFLDALLSDGPHQMSTGTALELAIVVDRLGDPVLSRQLDDLVEALWVETVALTDSQVAIARAAYRDFGKGTGHPAGLNFGDCFAYALARQTGQPLLFKGDDFTRTDVALPELG